MNSLDVQLVTKSFAIIPDPPDLTVVAVDPCMMRCFHEKFQSESLATYTFRFRRSFALISRKKYQPFARSLRLIQV